MTLSAGSKLGRYDILAAVGAGGMGEVYRARDGNLHRDVAIKVLPTGMLADDAARRRFRKEALALARLNHPNIATIYDFETRQGVDFVVMEYVPGFTLSEKLKSGALPENDVIQLGTQLIAGIGAAHGQGVIHCDLKPGNLRITADAHLKILDFGLARFSRSGIDTTVTETLTEVRGVAGTLPYMAPEQLLGQKVDARTDVYAVGAVLYEMTTGRRPFDHVQKARLLGAILHESPMSPTALNPHVPIELERIILKSLDKDPDRRYQSARELQMEVEHAARHPRVTRRPGANARHAWQSLCARVNAHPWRAALYVLLCMLAIAALMTVRSRPALSFAPRDWILVTDFANDTGESVFDRSLLTALTISLEQSVHVNVVSPPQIADTLKRMAKPAAEKITEELGREICLRENIKGLLSCRISRVGQSYFVSARLIDPRTGTAVHSYLERAKSQNGLLTALDRISGKLRRELGESLTSIQRSDHPLPQVTTASLQALKYYAEGRDAWKAGKHTEARQLYLSALQVDPDFAMAHAALGTALASFVFNDPVGGTREFEKALQLADRTTDRERLAVKIGYAHALNHVAEATDLYRIYLDRYPDDISMRKGFAYLLMQSHQFGWAIDQYKQVLGIAPSDAGAWINLATSEGGEGKVSDALQHYNEAFRLEPNWITTENLNHEHGFTLVRSGNEIEARRVFELALGKPELKNKGLRSLAWLALYHGRHREARQRLRDALLIDEANRSTLSVAREHVILSIVAEGRGDRADTVRELDAAARLLPQVGEKVWLGSVVGSAYARNGMTGKAARIAALIEPLVDQSSPWQNRLRHNLDAEIALSRGQSDRAIELFKLAENEERTAAGLYGLGRAYEAAASTDQAVSWYGNFITLPKPPLGDELQQDWLAAHYRLAAIYLARGNAEKSAPLLERLLGLWKDADSGIPLIKQAKTAYQSIQAK
jgi:tetratricopeptide (TPR) repeat protein